MNEIEKKAEELLEEIMKLHYNANIADPYSEIIKKQERLILQFATEIAEQYSIQCSECGRMFLKKEIIIQGDIDTCDDCLCPE